MDIYLHIGAHRTATTSFQHYMRANGAVLRRQGLGFWGPVRTRSGLFHGVIPVPGRRSMSEQMARARGRIALRTAKLQERALDGLVVSDENFMGSMRSNLRNLRLYPAAGERMARFHAAFGGQVARVAIGMRAPSAYWASALAYSLERVGQVPGDAELRHIARCRRSWRDVITDVACAMPGVDIVVLPHEHLAMYPETRLAALTGRCDVPLEHARRRFNAAPQIGDLCRALAERGADIGRFGDINAPSALFTREQAAEMNEIYADDLYWLRAGADGLARLCEETEPNRAGINPAVGVTIRGQGHGKQTRRMA